MSFGQQVFVTILDKALISAMLVVFSLWASRTVEKYKARQSLLSKFRERRLEVVFPIVLKLQEWQFLLGLYFDEMRKLHVNNLDKPDERSKLLLQRFAQFTEQESTLKSEIQGAVESNRFLLGATMVSVIEGHVGRLTQCVGEALSDKPYDFEWANAEAFHKLPPLEELLKKIEKTT